VKGKRRSITLLELLLVIGIISLLTAIGAPALNQARARGRLATCLANCRSINAAMNMYLSDDGRNLPWFYIHRRAQDGRIMLYPGATAYTTFSWGGMLPPISQGTVDSQLTPAELRPFNRYLAPDAAGFAEEKVYICPSDAGAANPSFGSGAGSAGTSGGAPNWQEFGTSYSISWHWLWSYRHHRPDLDSLGERLFEFGPQMLKQTAGGRAAELIWNSENHFDQMVGPAAMPEETAPERSVRGAGWHGGFLKHSVMFLDGHAEHGVFDTIRACGPGWTVRP